MNTCKFCAAFEKQIEEARREGNAVAVDIYSVMLERHRESSCPNGPTPAPEGAEYVGRWPNGKRAYVLRR
jgi:hypothetical protein